MEQNQYCGYIFIDLFLFANESEICNYANDNTFYSANKNICDALRDLVPLYNFKNVKNTPCNFTKSKTTPWVFFMFLNRTNGTKSRKTY